VAILYELPFALKDLFDDSEKTNVIVATILTWRELCEMIQEGGFTEGQMEELDGLALKYLCEILLLTL